MQLLECAATCCIVSSKGENNVEVPKMRKRIRLCRIKDHLGIYPGEEAIVAFADELSEYSVSKGTIRVPYDKPLPTELIEKIARWCYEKHSSQMIR